MIDFIKIAGLKSFDSLELNLGRLTVLTGLNNSGKSTVMQSLRMCDAIDSLRSPHLPGFGGYSEIKSDFTAPNEDIVIDLRAGTDAASISVGANNVTREGRLRFPLVQFIAADRYGPRVELPTQPEAGAMPVIGEKGEHSAHFASILENLQIAELLRHRNSSSHILKHQLAAWMGEISPGVKLNFDIQPRYDSSRLEVDGKRATNSGFGISYTLPIILLLLAMTSEVNGREPEPFEKRWLDALKRSGSLLLVENPEAHLHPKGQTSLGLLFVLAMRAGLQIVLETHSDHLIDGIRLGVRQAPELEQGKVRLMYFEKSADAPSRKSEIEVRGDGSLSEWPKGFFDQMTENLRALSS